MMLLVETPDGIVTGSSVMQVSVRHREDDCSLARDIEANYGQRGEAVALQVLPSQRLFPLAGNPADLKYGASSDPFGDIPRHERGTWQSATPDQAKLMDLIGGRRPRLVTFGDIDDSVTDAAVDPDNLAATFGDDVALNEVTVEITWDVPSSDIPSASHWSKEIQSDRMGRRRYGAVDCQHRMANSLSAISFSTEVGQ